MNSNKITFQELPLVQPLQLALKEVGYTHPSPIQIQAIPVLLEGKDVLGIAQTGTGKTAAFALPLLQSLAKNWNRPRPFYPRALILSPTRELALQIHQNIVAYSKHLKIKSSVIFGGVGQGPQVNQLKEGVDILVATPGRLLDLMNQRYIELSMIEYFILDEADQMLDMGFFPDIKRVVQELPDKRQSLFFSATMPKEIKELSSRILKNPHVIEIKPEQKTAEKVTQKAFYVDKDKKFDLLSHLLKDNNLYKVLVFVDMKHVANKITDRLLQEGIPAVTIHSNKSQSARQRALEDFKSDKARVLVATDIAARGIDVDGVTHVINFDLSHLVENYVHRIGRTARAGMSGEAFTFCHADEKSFLFAIEKMTNQTIPIDMEQPFHSIAVEKAVVTSVGKAKSKMEAERLANKPKRGGGGGQGGGRNYKAASKHRGPASSGGPKGRSSQGKPSATGQKKNNFKNK